jgi:hypothetical protein
VRERGTVTRPERHEILRPGQRAERVPRMPENHVKTVERQLQPRGRADRLLMRPATHQQATDRSRLELIQLRRSPPTTINRLSTLLDIPLHRPPITTKQPADLGIAQPLTLQRPDIHQLLLADQHGLPAREHEPHEPQHRTQQNPSTNGHPATPAARRPSSPPLPELLLKPTTHPHISMPIHQHYSMLIGAPSWHGWPLANHPAKSPQSPVAVV